MLLTKLRHKYQVHCLIEIFLSFVYTHTQKMYGKSHWWNVTRLFPSPKRHLLGGATEKRTESEECWDTPSTTKSTWEHVECLVWQIHLAFSVLFSRKKSFFEAKMWREDIQHHLEARKKSCQPWRPLRAHRLSNQKLQCHYRRPIIAAKVCFSISTQDIVHRHCGCVMIKHQSDTYRRDVKSSAISFVCNHTSNQRRRGSTLMADSSYI